MSAGGQTGTAQLFACGERRIEPGWASAIGHMRAHQYVALFDDATTAFMSGCGLTDQHLLDGGTSPFLTEMHVSYLRELRPGEKVAVLAQVLGHDERRGRVILIMQVAPGQNPAATCELAVVNMDLAQRRPCPWSPQQAAIWSRLAAGHAGLPVPPQAGRAIGPIAPVQDRQTSS
ncbi:MAG: thioesterase family protein [Hyphomicrobiaceae bacterium]|nr:thioesterase family protein [Hyphomicrobiaceae bacterium]